jgi:hypothetical protein
MHAVAGLMRGGRESLTPEALERVFGARWPVRSQMMMLAAEEQASPIVEYMTTDSPWLGALVVQAADGRPRRIGVAVDPEPPHLVRGVVRSAIVEGMTTRDAVPEDAEVQADIERSAPIVAGDVRLVYDRSPDYFAGERLMGDTYTMVFEMGGRPLGLMSTVRRQVMVDGQLFRCTYAHRLRVSPEGRGGMATAVLWEGFSRNVLWSEFPYAFMSAGNEAILRTVPPRNQWEVRPERVVIDAARHAREPVGRPAEASDAARIVELLNDAHRRSQLFVPYTVESLTQRLEREPALYSWPHMLLGERAVVGVWVNAFRVLRTEGETTTEDVRSLVLDYGCEAGAEEELVALLRGWCREVHDAGSSELTIFTSPGARGHDALLPLSKRIEPYVTVTPIRPSDLSGGVYVDQLFF